MDSFFRSNLGLRKLLGMDESECKTPTKLSFVRFRLDPMSRPVIYSGCIF